MIKNTTYLILGLVLALPVCINGQINQLEFGKNRVQYHRFFDEWSQYESENFIAYWYGQGRFVGQAAVQIAETDYEEVQKILEYRLNEKIEIIVYADITDLHQSNIGASETFATQNGQVKVIGQKIFVHFNGDHTHLRRQIREGIATVFMNAMLFGANLQEVVQNAISLNLPEWYKQGLIAYIGEEWNTQNDDHLRDIFQNKKYKNFNKFALKEPHLAGHMFWYYIAQQFGKANVSNLLYLTRINRSMDDALMYVVGSGYEAMSLACMEFFKKRYDKELGDATKLAASKSVKFKNKFKLPLTQPKLSPDGKRIAYILNEIGRWKVYVQDVQSGKRTLILRGGTRNPFQATDYNYPLVAWNPDNQRLFVMYERRDVAKLLEYNLTDKKRKTEDVINEFQRVYSMDFMNPKDLVLSAAVRGFSDIFLYNTVNRSFKRITNDFWDDLDAVYVNLENKKGILFASNRLTDRLESEKLDSVMPVAKFDLFYKSLDDTSKTLVRVSQTVDADERQPIAIDTTHFSFLSDESGIYNRQMAYLHDVLERVDTIFYTTNTFREVVPMLVMQDSARLFADSVKIDSVKLKEVYKKIAIVRNNSNFNRNILAQHSAPRIGKAVELYNWNGLPQLNIRKLTPDSALTPNFTRYWEIRQRAKGRLTRSSDNRSKNAPAVATNPSNPPADDNAPPKTEEPKRDTVKKVDIDNYVFQSEFDDKEAPRTTQITKESPTPKAEQPSIYELDPSVSAASGFGLMSDRKIPPFRQNRITPYRLKFRNDFFTTKLDNSLLFGGLDSYAGNPQGFNTPPMGILMKGNFKDLLEDYQLEGGVRLATTFNSYEAFVLFDDKKRQLDRRYAIYHRSTRSADNTSAAIDTRRNRYQTTLGQYELRYPLDMYTRLQATGTMRFDRYTPLATDSITLRNPSVSEQRIGAKLEYVFDNTLDVDVNIKNGTRYKIWTDFVKRFDLNLTDEFSFKFRDGFMGVVGFDARHYQRVLKHSVLAVRGAGQTSFGNERTLYILGGIDNQLFAAFDNNISIPAGNYAFQTLAANMRGFSRNIRNGTSFALINAELRVPIVKYLFSKPITSSFWRNLQLVGFFDAGTAWHGSNPFLRENPLNTSTLPANDPNSPVVVQVNYFRDPIVASYGVGARVLLFGYMIRADYGWGIETRIVQKPRLHIAIGTDF